jgi:hypothetical protein
MGDDEFFRQLAGGMLADHLPGAKSAPRHSTGTASENGQSPGGRSARPRNRSPRPRPDQSTRSRAPARARPSWARLGALGAIAVALGAVPVLLLGSGGKEPAARHGTDVVARAGKPNGRPATAHARLVVAWRARGREAPALEVPWRSGGRAEIAGGLTAAAGRPIAGARIGVLAADAHRPEEGSRTVGELRTDSRGRFATAVALDRGAPRKLLTFTYLAHSDDDVPAATVRARLTVVAAISTRTSSHRARRGTSVLLGGQSPGGATVEVLSRHPGSEGWLIASVAQATHTGRWEAAVYFPSYAQRGVYRLRARVVGDERRSFLSADSRPVEVRVR